MPDKLADLTVAELRKRVAKHNKKHPGKHVSTTTKVKKGKKTTYKPKKKSALIAAARKAHV
jgi:hypothetical protein